MISKIRTYSINTVKLLILSLIIVLMFHPLSVTPEQFCSLKENIKECKECCCSWNNDSCCKTVDTCSENNDEISCICKYNMAEPAEEQKNPLNLNTNIQKLIAGIKSDLLVKIIDSDIKENSSLITLKTDTPVTKFGIYLEISSLRI